MDEIYTFYYMKIRYALNIKRFKININVMIFNQRRLLFKNLRNLVTLEDCEENIKNIKMQQKYLSS